MGIIDKNGISVVEYQYDAWGAVEFSTVGNGVLLETINPFGYRGYVYDSEIKCYYLRSRWYNCNIGRFINEDILVSSSISFVGKNMYAYALNNCVCSKDTSGTRPIIAMSVQEETSAERKEAMKSMRPAKTTQKTYLKAMPKFKYASETITKQIDRFLARSNMKRLTDVTVVKRDGNTYYACHYGGLMSKKKYQFIKKYERVVGLFAVEEYESTTTYGDAFSLGMSIISEGAGHMVDMSDAMKQSAVPFEYLKGIADVADEVGIGDIGSKPIISGTYVRLVEGHFWDE